MCGITGILDLEGATAEALQLDTERMTRTLAHRGPDDSGIWVDEEQGVALGHRRLSIIDLSPCGHQPMLSNDGRYVITFNGEIFNFRAVRAELEAFGRRFKGHSDTEVLLEAICHWGVDGAMPRLVGMFAFALWDRQERTLTLARDRLGKKPLYYGWQGRRLLLASELKAIRANPHFDARVDRDALTLYLRHGYVPTPFSIFEGYRKLPAAHLVTFSRGREPHARPYWSLREVCEQATRDPLRGSMPELVEGLDQVLRDAVKVRMESDVPLGAFLSGGVDSSTVVALMQAQSTRPVRTFTIGFHRSQYNEATEASRVARHLGTDHTELYVTPNEAHEVIPLLPRLYDEPFGDSSGIPTFLLARLARQHVTVSLSGDGGDELFAGYNRHVWVPRLWSALGWIPEGLRWFLARSLNALSPAGWERLFSWLGLLLPRRFRIRIPGDKTQKLAEILCCNGRESMYRTLISWWKDPAGLVLGGGEPQVLLTDPAAWARLPSPVHRMMFLDAVTYLPDDILAKVDRATMGVSLEARQPLLDHRVIQYAWRLPLNTLIYRGHGKGVLREVLKRYVPVNLFDRAKMGFGVPIDQWLRGQLRGWAQDLIDPSRIRREGFFRPESIERLWRDHQAGACDGQHPLWAVLMFQAWLQQQKIR